MRVFTKYTTTLLLILAASAARAEVPSLDGPPKGQCILSDHSKVVFKGKCKSIDGAVSIYKLGDGSKVTIDDKHTMARVFKRKKTTYGLVEMEDGCWTSGKDEHTALCFE